ncbi:hypothetical protein FZ025_01220 [Xanthomonas hyacinthi]|uniref:hypothetical protein n=1 Tax=Xanthomonas hyacinthi TaxID=56455 RepID=UPI000A8AFB4A|nr:hypothetical protein [Xanthomonas hyacinthi]QGY75359.1 hypothetical protein FZ025_01220 [Xanthomonas hyacinthi]
MKYYLCAFGLLFSASIFASDFTEDSINLVFKSVKNGNAAKLKEQSSANDAYGYFSKAGYYRINGQLDVSTNAADKCIASLSAGDIKAKAACQLIKAGNYLMVGSYMQWAGAMADMRAYSAALSGIPDLNQIYLTYPKFLRDSFTAGTIVEEIEREGVENVNNKYGIPLVRLKVGNTLNSERSANVDLVIDLGSSYSILNKKIVDFLGVKTVLGFQPIIKSGKEVGSYNLIGPLTLEINGVRLRNIYMADTDVEFNILGRDLLRLLGPSKLTQDKFSRVSDQEFASLCKSRGVITSEPSGGWASVRVPAVIGPRPVLIKVETGSNSPLQADGMDLRNFGKDKFESYVHVSPWSRGAVQYVRGVAEVKTTWGSAKTEFFGTSLPTTFHPWKIGFANQAEFSWDIGKNLVCFSTNPLIQ